jgi:hypothetical protein
VVITGERPRVEGLRLIKERAKETGRAIPNPKPEGRNPKTESTAMRAEKQAIGLSHAWASGFSLL